MSDLVTYTAVLPTPDETVLFVSGLLAAERRRRGTRRGRRALGCYRQAVLVLRWFLDATRLAQLAVDNRIGRSTAYAICTRRSTPVDGTLIRTDHCKVPGPTAPTDRPGRCVDLWWAGKRSCHGGNVQVVAAPDGWPIWTSPVWPDRRRPQRPARS